MSQKIRKSMTRILSVGLLVGAGLVVSAASAVAQPYVVSFTGPSGKVQGGNTCAHYATSPPGSPLQTSCWGVVVFYLGTFLGFNNYSVGGENIWTANFACPSVSANHTSLVWYTNGPALLKWKAHIEKYGYISYVDGQLSPIGNLNRNLAYAGVDPSKCNP